MSTRHSFYELQNRSYRTPWIKYNNRILGQMEPRQFARYQVERTVVRVSWDQLNVSFGSSFSCQYAFSYLLN